MTVYLFGYTVINREVIKQATGFETEGDGAQDLAEVGGRLCYEAFGRKNPATATNAGYLANIKEHRHYSVLEHGSATFLFTDVSRSLTHELVRHRHLSYSQRSQRYVDESAADTVIPPAILEAGEPWIGKFIDASLDAQDAYKELVDGLTEHLREKGETGFDLRKHSRQAARGILPNAVETKILVSGNHRAWRHFIDMRATKFADVEIRKLALDVLLILKDLEPNIYADYEIFELPDGTLAATSKLAEVS